ncbi:MAG: peptidoglycan DD-metalloendopeptidase family protein [Chloroflexi bacterium]|nr:peptidoglycan DD-metalloendopeptidase family protein [Chloroflexota bacterium]
MNRLTTPTQLHHTRAPRPALRMAAIAAWCWLAVSCQPDPVVVVSTHTPLPPALSVVTSTPAPTETSTLTPTVTDTPTLTPSPTLTPTITDTPTVTPITPSPTVTPSPTPTFTLTPTPTLTRTAYPTKKPGATVTPAPRLPPLSALPPPHLWLARPIGAEAVNYVEPNYRYGSTEQGTLPPHHGVEFFNKSGTPIIAAADGRVVFAGPDTASLLGPTYSFYGNAVVVELAQSINGQPVYNLYGHMSVVSVKRGQIMKAGDLLGKVGGTGVAAGGPHLHFEVRVGYNDYYSTRNPELWLVPFPNRGTLAGRIVDSSGRFIPLATITVRSVKISGGGSVNDYLTTYAAETVNADSAYGENFALMDLPAGTYVVTINTSKTIQQTVTITAGAVSWVEFRDVKPPSTWTPTPTGTRTTATPHP